MELAKDICNGGSVSTCAEVAEKNAPLCMQEKSVLVTDFVDLNSLTPKPAGIVMGEVMRSALNSVCGYNIQQAELSKYFTLNEKGLGVLTRNNLLIRQDEVKKDFIVGTYSQSPDKLMIFVKKFDLTTGKITKMSSKEITFTCSDNKITYKVY
ncbi:FlgO family outer membrane protein [Geobacter sp. OR-1]|uniref:FlgO family outer membrane protein n=1 Tax=Geobacter sp. OR-1 TaxID=1266765 RepID=UPI00126A42BD|nr:FlgO family outer membrane protein [Geobacter sp. OR-1]